MRFSIDVLAVSLSRFLAARPPASADRRYPWAWTKPWPRPANTIPNCASCSWAADAAGWKKLESISAYIPHLDVKGNYLAGADYTRLNVVFGGEAIVFPEAFPQSEVDLEASWLIFDGFGAWGGFRADSLEAEAAALDAKHAQSHLEQAVRTRFYKALAAQQLVTVADQNIATLEQHADLADASEKAGFATKVDTLRIGSQLEEARAEKLLALDNAVLTRQDLASAVGVSADARALDGSLPVPDATKVPADLTLDPSPARGLCGPQAPAGGPG